MSPAGKRLASGRAWDDFCESVRRAGHLIERFGDEVDDLDRAEWYRFLTRLMRNGFERYMENCEPERPRLRDAPWRQGINFQSPDQDHLLAEFVDGRFDYRITGVRGNVPYFVMAAWTAKQPADPGARDWAPRGVDGLAEFDPATLRTTGFLTSDDIRFDPDGRFEVIVSRERPAGDADWLPITPDCVGLLVRVVHHRREETLPPVMHISRLDGAAPRPIRPAEVSDGLAKSAQMVLGYAELVRRWWQDNLGKRPNRIRFSRAVYLSNGGVPDRHHGFGTWAKTSDEALVISFRPDALRLLDLPALQHLAGEPRLLRGGPGLRDQVPRCVRGGRFDPHRHRGRGSWSRRELDRSLRTRTWRHEPAAHQDGG